MDGLVLLVSGPNGVIAHEGSPVCAQRLQQLGCWVR